jgi:hypothetical protein
MAYVKKAVAEKNFVDFIKKHNYELGCVMEEDHRRTAYMFKPPKGKNGPFRYWMNLSPESLKELGLERILNKK